MKKNFFIKITTLIALVFTGFSCVDDGSNPVEGKGKKRFRVPNDGNYYMAALDSDAPVGAIFTVYRDVTKPSDYGKSVTLNYTLQQSVLDDWNAEHVGHTPATYEGDSLFLLAPNIYDLSSEGGTIEFGPGEAQKEIVITVDPALLTFDKMWALPFVFTSSDPEYDVSNVSLNMIVQVGVKNKYDGIYNVTGNPWTHVTIPTITGLYPYEWQLITTGPNQVEVYDPYWPGVYHPITSGTARSVFGQFGLVIDFDPETGKATLSNYWNPTTNTRDLLQADDLGPNQWNEEDGSIDLSYHMTQSSIVAAPPHIVVTFKEHLTRTGSRP